MQTSIAAGNLAVAALIDAFKSATFTAPTLGNSWINYGSGFSAAGYFKDASGIVRIRGLISAGVLGNPAFTLPVGYRPAARTMLAGVANAGGGDQLGRVDVDNDGTVTPMTGGNVYFAIEVSFKAAT